MNQKEKVFVALQNAAKQSEETAQYLNEVVKAQNLTGVLVMTLLQMLLEKNMVTKAEIQRRFDLNKSIAISEDGDCKVSLSKLLEGIEEEKA
jgi:predicted transcriptional regulator